MLGAECKHGFRRELLPSEEEKMLAEIEKLARRLGIELEELQQQAVLESIKHGILSFQEGRERKNHDQYNPLF
ncbi:MAG: hypothetical protein ACLVAW_06950 [Eisenbergiella massiliensis]